MKAQTIIISFLILLCSCAPKEKGHTTIELISYNWNYWNENKQKYDSIMSLYWGIYSFIEDSGDAYVCFNNYRKFNERKFIKLPLDTRKIKNIIEISKNYSKTSEDFKNQIPTMYDGPSFKMRINYADKSFKTINFTESGSFVQDTAFANFYEYIWLRCRIENHEILTDTADIALKLNKYIEYITYDDAKYCCPPPMELLGKK